MLFLTIETAASSRHLDLLGAWSLRNTTWEFMDQIQLLRDKVARCDAVLMTVIDKGQQQYIGKVEKVYSRRFEGPHSYDAAQLSFVGSTGAWGNQALVSGERALVFMSYLSSSERYYQDHWHGHFTVVSINGEQYAVANWHLIQSGERSWGPTYLRDSAFLPNNAKPWQVAMPYALLERHLIEELNR